MRDLDKVIGDMLAVIPADETALIAQLSSLRTSARYTAPEVMAHEWRKGMAILEQHMAHLDEIDGWHKRVLETWSGR